MRMQNSYDMELFDKDGYMFIKEAEVIEETALKVTLKAHIKGDVEVLRKSLEDENGKKFEIIPKVKEE